MAKNLFIDTNAIRRAYEADGAKPANRRIDASQPFGCCEETDEMRIEKPREWTEAEVQEAIAALKREPGLWEELKRLEPKRGNVEDFPAWVREVVIVSKMHRECNLRDKTHLLREIRKRRRQELGLTGWD